MGFYSPDQVLQDAGLHGIEIRAIDVTVSDRDCTLEALDRTLPAIRLGLRMIKGLSEEVGRRIEVVRETKPFRDISDLCLRAGLDQKARDLRRALIPSRIFVSRSRMGVPMMPSVENHG